MRRQPLILTVTLGLLLLASCGNSETTSSTGGSVQPAASVASGSTMAAIQNRGRIVIGTKFDQPLFGERAMSDTPEGFDVEIGKLVAKALFGSNLDGKVQFVETPSKVRESSISEGKVDIVVATYTINDARKQQVSFAGPYYSADQDLLVKKDNTSITGPESLAGKKVCSVAGSTSLVNVQKAAPQADTSIVFDTYSKCVEALTDGRVEAVTTDDAILLGFVARNDQLKVVGKKFSKEPYGIGLKKDAKDFRDFINDVLEKAERDGTWAKLFEEQVGSRTHVPTPAPPAIERY